MMILDQCHSPHPEWNRARVHPGDVVAIACGADLTSDPGHQRVDSVSTRSGDPGTDMSAALAHRDILAGGLTAGGSPW